MNVESETANVRFANLFVRLCFYIITQTVIVRLALAGYFYKFDFEGVVNQFLASLKNKTGNYFPVSAGGFSGGGE